MTKKLTDEEKKANKLERLKFKELIEELEKVKQEKSQPPVKELVISIEWKKSRMWGYNPHADVAVTFKTFPGYLGNNFSRHSGYTASGYGYDKQSTVIAHIFNDFLKYKLWNKSIEQCKRADYEWKEKGGAPYGISAGSYDTTLGNTIEYRSFSGGIGTNCYYAISEFIGGKFECVASGKSFDVYKYTDNEEKL